MESTVGSGTSSVRDSGRPDGKSQPTTRSGCRPQIKDVIMRRYIGMAVGVGLIVAAFSATGALPAAAQGAVRPLLALIVNDVGNPVPVAGTVALAPGSQVGLRPGGTVEVGNTSTNPVLVRNVDGNAAPQPFRLDGDEVCSPGLVKGIVASNDTGKLMVVENVSFMVQIRKGFAVTQAAMYIDSGIPSVVFGVLQIPEIIGAFSKFGGSAAVKAYIAPGRNAALSIAETSNGDCNLHFEVTGVLVNP